MRPLFRIALAVALLGSIPASAGVYLVPSDEEMIRRADVIVVGTITSIQPLLRGDGDIDTTATVTVDTVLKGPDLDGDTIEVRDAGGIIGDSAMFVSGWNGYTPGERVLVFIEHRDDGSNGTYGLALGKFNFVTDMRNRRLLVRGLREGIRGWTETDFAEHRERPRLANDFIRYIRGINGMDREHIAPEQYLVEPQDVSGPLMPEIAPLYDVGIESHYPASAYTQGTFRWKRFDDGLSVTYYTSGVQGTYDTVGTAQRALAAWTNDPNSNVNLVYGGNRTGTFISDGVNTIVYNNTGDVPAGAIAYAKWYGGGNHTYKNESFWTITEGDVVVKSGLSISQKAFDEAVTHEVGHTLGFRHSNDGTPASSDAVMNSVVTGRFGATLGPWDVEAVTHVYGSGTTTPPPTGARAAKGDFNRDGRADLVWQNSATGAAQVWLMNGTAVGSQLALPNIPAGWQIVAVDDFNRDGSSDLVLRNASTSRTVVWYLNGVTYLSEATLPTATGSAWQLVGADDFNRDGSPDLVWQNTSTFQVVLWLMNGTTYVSESSLPSVSSPAWSIRGVGDFNADGSPDLVWRNSQTLETVVWLLNGTRYASQATLPSVSSPAWNIYAIADYNGNGRPDVVWRNTSTFQAVIWLMNGTTYAGEAQLQTVSSSSWRIAGPR